MNYVYPAERKRTFLNKSAKKSVSTPEAKEIRKFIEAHRVSVSLNPSSGEYTIKVIKK